MNKKQKTLIQSSLMRNEQLNKYFSADEINSIVDETIQNVPNEKWWIIALKVLAYLIGLILAGVGTASAATTFINF